MTGADKKSPATEAQSSRALAQMLGKFAALVILLILALLIERYCSIKPEPFGPTAKIVSIDGDTLRVGDGSEVRLFGVDAPELHQTCEEANGKSWACGRAAKTRLTLLIKGGNVQCEERSKDRFGRVVAVCSAQGVPDLGQTLVRQGYAIDLGGPPGNPYNAEEEEAKTAKRGLWRGSFEPPWEWREAHPRL
ncbi:MAG TPA: thermonuclease family protein [Methyloceanibacter sp.]